MSATGFCDLCGTRLPPRAPAGLCPKCLLARAVHAPVAADVSPLHLPEGSSGLTSAATHTKSEIRSPFGDYELLEKIAEGGMGVVYRARQISLNRIVAVKMIQPGRVGSADMVLRFRAEAEAAASLHHPNIVPIHETGECEGQHFFSMDFIEGKNLADAVREGPLPSTRAAQLVGKIAAAVHYAHQHNILHRDLKPSNVLMDELGEPHVTDFGLAKRLTSDLGPPTSDLTLTGQVFGSPRFMPPEQASGRRGAIGPHSDVYGLGAILYYLLTARPPFVGETLETTLAQVLEQEPVSPRLLNASVPRDLETICLKCLEKEPTRRYASAQVLADELGRFLEQKPIEARPVGFVGKTVRWCRRKPALAVALGAVVVVAAVGLVGVLWQWRRAETQRDVAVRAQTRAELENYDADIGKAQLLVEQSQFDLAEKILARGEHARYRGWEWGWLQRLCNQELMRFEHSNPVWSAVFSPDQRYLATGCVDGTVCLWDLQMDQKVRSFQGHRGRVASVAFSPDSTRLLTASYDGYAKVWDVASGDEPALTLAHRENDRENVVQAVFSGDGKLIATAAKTKGARLWDAHTGKLVRESTDHEQPVFTVAFGPDPEGRRLAWGGGQQMLETDADNAVTILDLPTGKRLIIEKAHRQTIFRLCFSPDGKLLATACPKGPVRLWNAETGEPAQSLKADFSRTWMMAATFSPDGRWLAVGGAGWEVARCQIFEVATGRLVRNLAGHNTMVQDVAFSRDGRWLATPGYEGTARVWSVDPVAEFLSLEGHDSAVWCVAFSSDGRKVASGSLDQTARVWDTDTGAALATITVGFPVVSLAFSPDGNQLLTVGPDHTACVWTIQSALDSRSDQREEALAKESEAQSPKARFQNRVAADVSPLHLPAKQSGLTSAATSTEPMCLRGHTGAVTSVAWSRDGRLILTSGRDGTARLWDADSGHPIRTVLVRSNGWITGAFSPDSRQIATGSSDATVGVWDPESGSLLRSLEGHTGLVQQVVFSPDGSRLATGSTDGKARLFDVGTGQLLFIMEGHRSGVSSLTFSPDGSRLATAGTGIGIVGNESPDPSVLIWDTHTGQRLLKLEAHPDWTVAVAFSPNGHRLATGSADNTVRIREAFAWEPDAYAEPAGAAFRERVETYKRRFWQEQMRSPSKVLPLGTEHVAPGRRWQDVYMSRINLPAEDGSKTRPTRPIPPRDPSTDANLIDLTPCYNAALTETWVPVSNLSGVDWTLSSFPAGITNLAGVPFDVRGLIRLRRAAYNYTIFPERVEITVGRTFQRLHVLHGASGRVKKGTRIGAFRLHYREGDSADLAIIHGSAQPDMGIQSDRASRASDVTLAWVGPLDVRRPTETRVQLFKSTYDNPAPDREVVRITFESAVTASGPFLLAMTVEP